MGARQGLLAGLTAMLVLGPLPAPAQTATAQVLKQAQGLVASGDYAAAVSLIEQGLATAEKPQIKLALLLRKAQYEQGMGLDQRSLASLKQAVEIADDAQLAYEAGRVQNELAALYAFQGRYDSALQASQQAVSRYQQLKASKGFTENGLARALLQQARIYVARGDDAQAIATGDASLRALDHANDHAFLCEQLLVRGDASFVRNGFGTKKAYVEQALQQALAAQSKPLQVRALTELSELYNSWGQPEQALLHLQDAIALAQASDRAQARVLTLQRGEIQLVLGQADAGRTDFESVRGLLAGESDRFALAQSLLRLGQAYAALREPAQAAQDYRAAQAGFEALALPYQAAQAIYGLGELARAAGRHAEAIGLYQQAIARAEAFGNQRQLSFYYGGLGQSQLESGQLEPAILSLEQAVYHGRQIYGQVGDEMKAEFFEKLVPMYQALIRAYFQAGRIEDALEAIEDSRGLSFMELLDRSETERAAKLGQLEDQDAARDMRPGSMALIYSAIDQPMMLQFSLRYNPERGKLPLATDIHAGKSVLVETLLSQDPLLRRQAATLGLAPGGGPLLPRLCQVYRQLLSNPESDPELIKGLGSVLYQVLIGTHEAQLHGIRSLLIVPEGELGLIPFETLRDPQGRYLVERFDIRYLHSFAVLHDIERRGYPSTRAPMLVVGDPVYEPLSYEREPIESAQQLLELKKLIWQFPTGSMREAYAALYSPQWEPLPGTRAEVAGIEKAIAGTRAVTGSRAEEAGLKAMAEAGELARYKVLHFATHGLAVPEIPELSALVLSQFSQAGDEDGYLRMPEIARLPLRADFVNLSACETGIGKIFKGEGVVGLAQAFLSAGANQVAVSLWQISDAGSAEFMQALYREPGEAYGASVNAIKRRFLAGEFGEAYRHPYYWSPFIVYGKL